MDKKRAFFIVLGLVFLAVIIFFSVYYFTTCVHITPDYASPNPSQEEKQEIISHIYGKLARMFHSGDSDIACAGQGPRESTMFAGEKNAVYCVLYPENETYYELEVEDISNIILLHILLFFLGV